MIIWSKLKPWCSPFWVTQAPTSPRVSPSTVRGPVGLCSAGSSEVIQHKAGHGEVSNHLLSAHRDPAHAHHVADTYQNCHEHGSEAAGCFKPWTGICTTHPYRRREVSTPSFVPALILTESIKLINPAASGSPPGGCAEVAQQRLPRVEQAQRWGGNTTLGAWLSFCPALPSGDRAQGRVGLGFSPFSFFTRLYGCHKSNNWPSPNPDFHSGHLGAVAT